MIKLSKWEEAKMTRNQGWLLWLLCFQKDINRVMREEKAAMENVPQSYWHVGKCGGIFLFNDCCGKAQTKVGGVSPELVFLGDIREVAKHGFGE